MVTPLKYSDEKQIVVSNEIIQKVEKYIKEIPEKKSENIKAMILGTLFIEVNHSNQPAFVSVLLNQSDHEYSNLVYNFSIGRKIMIKCFF